MSKEICNLFAALRQSVKVRCEETQLFNGEILVDETILGCWIQVSDDQAHVV